MKRKGKLFPILKIVTLNSSVASRTPLCTCDFKPVCVCDLKPSWCKCDYDSKHRCDCDARCTCDSYEPCKCVAKPFCLCDEDCHHCSCDSRKSTCYTDYQIPFPKVPLGAALPKGCTVDTVAGRALVRISAVKISGQSGMTFRVYYRDRESAELVDDEKGQS